MLETEEVDDDFFTPVSGTSLANIFGSTARNKEGTENDSLKYTPPKPQNIVPQTREQTKATECIVACVLNAHEWSNNVYTSKGKLGCAILKIQRTGDHNIVLYDSNKTTFSCTTISKKLDVTVKNNIYISYFDSFQKYWSICGTEEEIKKITEVLKNCGANIKYSTHRDKDPIKPKSETETNAIIEETEQRESDTDSSVHRKTKASILNRMANMGQSVLPVRTTFHKSSDSSDTNEIETQSKIIRHKPIKYSAKRNSTDNIVSEYQNPTEVHQNIIVATEANRPLTEAQKYANVYENQIMPIANNSVIASTSNELAMFMSEQRMSNSELRININRVHDKMNTVLDKFSSLERVEKSQNVSNEILLKLVTEYENKIKVYEGLLQSRNMDEKKYIESTFKQSNENSELESLKNKITEIENENEQKSSEISNLHKEIKLLKDIHRQEKEIQESMKNELLAKIKSLGEDLDLKNKQLNLTNNSSVEAKVGIDNIQEKVKNIMNDTFQTISVNFESNNHYTGHTIKRIIGTVIKKITIETLNEL